MTTTTTLHTTLETEHGITYVRLNEITLGYYAPSPDGGWHGAAYGAYPDFTTGHNEATEPAIRDWVTTTYQEAHHG